MYPAPGLGSTRYDRIYGRFNQRFLEFNLVALPPIAHVKTHFLKVISRRGHACPRAARAVVFPPEPFYTCFYVNPLVLEQKAMKKLLLSCQNLLIYRLILAVLLASAGLNAWG